MKLRSLALPLLGLAAVACVSPPSPGRTSALDDALTAQDFDATVRELTSLPWLPWGYKTDGCYARALYYSMLLATKGVPTNHLYVVARPGTSLGGIWSWHVAPLVSKDGDPNRLYVLDPVYDQTRALTNVEWVANQNHPDPAAPNYPRLHVREGTSYLDQMGSQLPLVNPAEPEAATYKEPAFADMPAFDMVDVRAACSIMHQYINIEPNQTAEQKSAKHTTLGSETVRIVEGLQAKKKLAGAPTLPVSCTRIAVTDAGTDASVDAGGGTVAPEQPVPIEGLPFTDPSRTPVVE